jgi:hypothetical protein
MNAVSPDSSPSMAANHAPVTESARALLHGLIDYAGLFPPAALTMPAAVANYAAYLTSEHRWMLGRFIVPVARLGEFENAIAQLPAVEASAAAPWALSALPGADVPADWARIAAFNDRDASHSVVKARIESIEVKASTAAEIEHLSRIIPSHLETYFEIPLTANLDDCLRAIAGSGRCAKIRTGGETADKFPAPESVVEFLHLSSTSKVPFKATAGLHHPLRSRHRLTYQPDSPTGIMHGFLNVFLAAAFLRAGMDPQLATDLMIEESPSAFHFGSEAVIWRQHRLNSDDISAVRNFAISFGSCSFTEPIDDLRALHLL